MIGRHRAGRRPSIVGNLQAALRETQDEREFSQVLADSRGVTVRILPRPKLPPGVNPWDLEDADWAQYEDHPEDL